MEEDNFKVFVNFKTYPQATGKKALELAKICREVAEEEKVNIIPVVQVVDLAKIKEGVGGEVWIQHVDWQPQGKFTGFINLEAVLEAGANGTLLNHSEHPLPHGTIRQILSRVRKGKFDFKVMVCCKTLGKIEKVMKMRPDFIGYEIAELIGGEVSIVDWQPKAIKHAKELCGDIPLIVGAGVNKAEDLRRAKDLGCGGVLISSAVVLAENPKERLKSILKL